MGVGWSDPFESEHEACSCQLFSSSYWLDANLRFQDGRESGTPCQVS